MNPGPIDKTVEKKLKKRKDRVTKAIETYLKNPEDNEVVHEVRTSLRRLEAGFSLLPKKTRRANSRYLKNCKNFFRANSKIRDFDVIRERIGSRANGGSSALQRELETHRKSELGRAKKLAALLADPPRIRRMHLTNSKVKNRASKVADRHIKEIQKLLPVVLADERKVDDLHSLRKRCKKLRYVLDTLGNPYRKKHESAFADIVSLAGRKTSYKDVDSTLREIQDMLGAIHDIDITIEFIEAHDAAKQLAASEKQKRREAYQKFAGYVNASKQTKAATAAGA